MLVLYPHYLPSLSLFVHIFLPKSIMFDGKSQLFVGQATRCTGVDGTGTTEVVQRQLCFFHGLGSGSQAAVQSINFNTHNHHGNSHTHTYTHIIIYIYIYNVFIYIYIYKCKHHVLTCRTLTYVQLIKHHQVHMRMHLNSIYIYIYTYVIQLCCGSHIYIYIYTYEYNTVTISSFYRPVFL